MYGYGNMISPTNRIFGGGGGANPLWDGLQAYYTADNTPNDATGNGNNGTLINGATYGTGKINNGFSFDNINDYFSLPNNTFTETGDFTISLWIKPDAVNNDWFLHFGQYQTATPKGILMYINAAGNLTIFGHNNGTQVCSLSGGLLSIGTWYNIVFVHTNSTKYELFINGVLISTDNNVANVDYPSPCICQIGRGDHSTRYFGGIIDEVALFNTTKTLSQSSEIYNSGSGLQYLP